MIFNNNQKIINPTILISEYDVLKAKMNQNIQKKLSCKPYIIVQYNKYAGKYFKELDDEKLDCISINLQKGCKGGIDW